MRLNKWLADRGVASRRSCDEMIRAGRVEVNGRAVLELGVRVDPESDIVKVDGEIPAEVPRVYFLLYKPKGVLCTNGPSGGKPRAIDMLDERVRQRIYCVGRLDEDSEGLILLTNDGAFAQLVAHPRHRVAKTYHLRVRGALTPEDVEKVRAGVHLSEGRTGGAYVRVLKRTQTFTRLLITIREGRNRELRRIFARLKHPVRALTRVRIGSIGVGRLKKGSYRRLKPSEVALLRELALERTGEGKGAGRKRGGARLHKRPASRSASRSARGRERAARPGRRGAKRSKHPKRSKR